MMVSSLMAWIAGVTMAVLLISGAALIATISFELIYNILKGSK